jgi:hypothetical protein
MSVPGIYNFHPKVEQPNKIFYQMESGGYQVPFYFGGSQVPINTNFMHGQGLRTPYESTKSKKSKLLLKGAGLGCGLETTVAKHNNIKIPSILKRI